MKSQLEKKYQRPINKLFFIGIGGSSMSGLATMALSQGFLIEGSDMIASSYTEKLECLGIKIHIGHHYENIPADVDCVVYSAAIHEDNPDMIKATDLNLPKIERSSFLGLFSHIFDKTIAVSGTHGKTTTSSMVACLLQHAELRPSLSIGGKLDEFGGNAVIDGKEFFVVEACEYVDSFLKTSHSIGIITNIEEDHLDYFTGGLKQIKASFNNFGKILPADGLMIAYGDSPDVMDVVTDLACPVVTYGLNKSNDWYPENIVYDNVGKPSFDVYKKGVFYGHYQLIIPGEHNVLNSLAAIICGDFLNIAVSTSISAMLKFSGAKRRFEFRGEVNGINVYEDYAHHPTELKVVVDACLNYDHHKLWVVFQPHTYSRTYFFFDDFVDAFAKADFVILNDIYSDREGNDWNIYSEDLQKAIEKKYGIPTVTISAFADIVDHLTTHLCPNDLVLVAGSQTINHVAFDLVDKLNELYKS
ncbi:UDP-N-acetylmuramate--L-alanine ligase [Acetobacterium woodii]|uniref:UDP-N-acetylmuramate--L-alanine ligase n=1 Tax=Acetobacterium woodii (strain ATCC 29683 / DSM 1030 / JCM 2381 / KCTC 1655 / WB1) TaxID=931626 RepID=H6LI32_ACEWD|nr:UDP-N-acetylmuramate--L-alanine ligase [Acetobacterium woodii]AFA49732.1 UDP-N-acetylmuramate--L-alanine ligase MurC [Acetobacterium woodii DSM 1030]